MPLQDPVAVYNAADNMQAQMVCNALIAAGLEAHVTEDVSQAGVWVGGVISEIHKPQVWVDRTNVERAVPILREFEERAAELHDDATEEVDDAAMIDALCEECGDFSTFPASQRGSVQVCPHCNAYMDVEKAEEDASEADDGNEQPQSEEAE
jgi:hypothetical protein